MILSLIAFGIPTGCISNAQERVGVIPDELKPCPKSPNCVSTKSKDPDRKMDPLPYIGTVQESHERLVLVLRDIKRCKIVTLIPAYIHAKFRSALFGFVDDVEFLFDNAEGMIHFRSASRKGYYDFGANRKRMKEISNQYLRAADERR